MQRNGKLPHPTTAVLEMPAIEVQASDSPPQGTDSLVQGTDSLVQGTDSLVQGAGSPLQDVGGSVRLSKQSIKVYRTDDSVDRRLMAAHLLMETLLGDPSLSAELSPYGYGMPSILLGQSLYQQALALVKQHRSSLGDQFTAADAYVSAQQQVHDSYKRHVAFARLALRNDRGAAQKLDLSARERSQTGWVLQADQFYTNALANPAIMAKLAGYSVTIDQLLETQQQVAVVAAGIVTQQQCKHAAQEAKQARDAALQALDRWIVDFRAVVRIALADQPQRLAQLGIGVAS
jgi:hypothetical protein